MSDRMRILPFETFLDWMMGEYEQHGSIFSIPESMFFRYTGETRPVHVWGASLDAPIGPAAGPHTQLAQNIVCSYITGCRFIELKTVQKLDNLEFDKPCIDVFDEGYNTEWSQELSLEDSFDEYLKAWFAVQVLAKRFGLSRSDDVPGFLFNMSVGYDLKGIQSSTMDRFIDSMVKPLAKKEIREKYEAYRAVLRRGRAGLAIEEGDIPDPAGGLVHSVTISTMHGCPQGEIESMASYLMGEKGMDTYVKLNPTLLGGEYARYILQRCGWDHVEIENAVFENDLQYPQAVELIRNLQAEAKSQGRRFGIKLSNTLANTNTGDVLPGEERYMSGRPLFPLTVNLACRLAAEFDGKISISYSGGASVVNTADLLRTGIRPVTMTTDMLKPGGYLRYHQLADRLHREWKGEMPPRGEIDVARLRELAENALDDMHYRKAVGKAHSIKLDSDLGMFDCVTAPCVHACPIHQNIPAYIEAVAKGDPDGALRVILRNNPLPHITGYICDHQCMEKCVRWDYDNPISIRALKRYAAVEGKLQPPGHELHRAVQGKKPAASVAVVGGGPAGLACSFFLAREGVEVTVFERHASPGGTVQHAIPRFRLPDSVVEKDISLVQGLGVQITTNWKEPLSIVALREQGFSHVVLAAGSGLAKELELSGSDGMQCYYTGIDFLHMIKRGEKPAVGEKVLVIGGGNSAVDAARAALRLSSGSVRIVYRRDLSNMPADREEIHACVEERIAIDELLSPRRLLTEKGRIVGLRCTRMKLGELDQSGRQRPVPIEGDELDIAADTVIAAIGEGVETGPLEKNRIALQDGRTVQVNTQTGETSLLGVYAAGDCVRGPATVVEAIADGKTVARSILKKMGLPHEALDDQVYEPAYGKRIAENQVRRSEVSYLDPVQTIPLEKRKGFDTVIQTLSHENAKRDGERCLRCLEYCSKCVEVCPNRANVTLFMDREELASQAGDTLTQSPQILHIDDFCNECGNCETFCVHEGRPYRVKPTLFSSEETFLQSENSGFYLKEKRKDGHTFVCRLEGHLFDMRIDNGRAGFSGDRETRGMTSLSLIVMNVVSRHRYMIG